MLLIKLAALCFLCGVFGRSINRNDPSEVVVYTRNGRILGRRHKTIEASNRYYSFKGVPYAEPPVRSLRFKPPVPKRPWRGVLHATEHGSDCVQGAEPVLGNEDCLTLNIYTTQYPGTTDSFLPVMVYIYGGGFMAGTSNYTTFGPDYLLDSGVLVVTINYRLGIFGFMSTGDLVVPGNNGLRDQILALKWVKENIRNFGGDTHKITIFGQSAGSVSVSYLLQTRLTDGLFHHAIMQSGVSLSLWGLSRHNKEITYTVAKDLGIPTQNSLEMVEKLKQLDYKLLQSKAVAAVNFKYLTINPREGFMFAPVIEPDHPDAVLSGKSHQLLSEGHFQKVPVMMGYNSLEGTFEIGGLVRVFLAKWDINPSGLIPIDMNIDSLWTRTSVGLKIKSHYFGFTPIALSNHNVMQFLGDDQFVRPVREKARLLSKQIPVYLYRFSYEGNLWGFINRTNPGVTHSEELGYIFVSKYNASLQDSIVRKRMVKLWTNFAKHGNPTPNLETTLQNINWVQAKTSNPDDLYYLNIDTNLETRINPDDENVKFWDKLYKENGHPPYDTY